MKHIKLFETLQDALYTTEDTPLVASLREVENVMFADEDDFGETVYIVEDFDFIKGYKPTEFVDLNLPSGLLWGSYNLGANSIKDVGKYFAWGDTVGYTLSENHSFTESNYKFGTYPHTKYNTTDLKSLLDPEDDPAYVILGEGCRTPTKEDYQELLDNTFFTWTTNYIGTKYPGFIVYAAKDSADKGKLNNKDFSYTPVAQYSISDPHIFLPATGYRTDESDDLHSPNQGLYLTGSAIPEKVYYTLSLYYPEYSHAYRFYMYNTNPSTATNVGAEVNNGWYRYVGRCIRPVKQIN